MTIPVILQLEIGRSVGENGGVGGGSGCCIGSGDHGEGGYGGKR